MPAPVASRRLAQAVPQVRPTACLEASAVPDRFPRNFTPADPAALDSRVICATRVRWSEVPGFPEAPRCLGKACGAGQCSIAGQGCIHDHRHGAAERVLGWRAHTDLATGLADLSASMAARATTGADKSVLRGVRE